MYFEQFNQIKYPFIINGKTVPTTLKDITNNVRIKEKLKSLVTAYNTYTIHDQDTPEIISETLYGTMEYYWILMILNERYDYLTDFPIPMPVFDEFCANKYGNNLSGIHHYEDIINGKYVTISAPLPLDPVPVAPKPLDYPNSSTPEYDAYVAYLEQLDLNDVYKDKYGITNYDYENRLNESKRELKYIPKQYIKRIANELLTVLK